MRNTSCYLVICLFLCSCGALKISASKTNISDLGIYWHYPGKVNAIYQPRIDSVFDNVINKFNSEDHAFKVHKRSAEDLDYVQFTFNKGRFVSNAGVTTGYVLSGIGLIATPIIVLAATGGDYFGLFYYFPQDNLNISTSLSPSLVEDKVKLKTSTVEAGALFSNKTKRMNKISNKLESSIYKVLLNLDKQMTSRK